MDSPRVSKSSKLVWRRQYETFRRRLVEAREGAGLTQRDVAKRLGRSQSFVAKSENGERRVDVIELMEFAKVYRRSLTYFVR